MPVPDHDHHHLIIVMLYRVPGLFYYNCCAFEITMLTSGHSIPILFIRTGNCFHSADLLKAKRAWISHEQLFFLLQKVKWLKEIYSRSS